MEYTKDIILDVRHTKKIGIGKVKDLGNKIKKIIINNKMIVTTLSLVTILITIDFILLNSFFELLKTVY